MVKPFNKAKAGIEAIYLSGWQVAADNNTASTMYPDQSLYPVDSVPSVVKRINNSFRRADKFSGLLVRRLKMKVVLITSYLS